jgi:hypothetical protein
MNSVDDFLDAVKTKTGSDYKTGKFLEISSQHVSNWRARRSYPSNKHVIELCKECKLDIGEAIIAIEYSRENERPLREAGFIDLGLLVGMSGVSLGVLTLAKMSALPYEALALASISTGFVYYVKLTMYTDQAAEVIHNFS